MTLAERVYVVTGSTQGIGEAIARRIAGLGAAGVVVTGRSRARGDAVAAALEAGGTAASFVEAALEDPAAPRAIVAACEARFGRLDGLVNVAAITDRGTLDDTSVELWDRMFAINVRAPFLLAQEGVRLMRRGGRGGAIVSVSSMSGHGGQSNLVAYSASKGALGTLTKNLANGLRHERIRVNAINLGWTASAGEHDIQRRSGAPADWLEKAEAAQPFGRLIRPEEVAALATYLLSDDAIMMTGSLIDMDQNVVGARE